MFHRSRPWFHEMPPEPFTEEKVCDHPSCQSLALYRAPKSRQHMNSPHAHDWLWFCLEHVRQYNASWNYYAHMSETEVEADTRANHTWQRPSWPMGTRLMGGSSKYADPFDLTGEPDVKKQPAPPQLAEVRAMAIFDLRRPFTLQDLTEAYRALAKKHHPDVNGGSLHAEEKIKDINEAYTLLKQFCF